MAAARRGLSAADPVHGASVSIAEVEHLLDWLSGMSTEKRAQVDGLSPQRADIIVAGLAVTAEVLERIEAREVKISAFGLREGLLLEMAGADNAPAAVEPLRLIREFAELLNAWHPGAIDLEDPNQVRSIEHLEALRLPLVNLLARWIVTSKLGRVLTAIEEAGVADRANPSMPRPYQKAQLTSR
mgnify:CR=1 FL=1